MLVDGHAHVVQEGWFAEPWWRALARQGAAELDVPPELIRDQVIPAFFDEDGSGQLAAMDEAGVDVAVLFPIDWTLEPHLGRPPVGWREQNEWYARLAEAHPGRIRWGFGADPRHDGVEDAFEEAVRDRGAICLKVHPSGGFPLDDPTVYALVERAGGRGVPVVVHVGPSLGPLYSKWSAPMLLDALAADFPDVRFQAAHTGNASWREVLAVATVKPNVYCDLSGWQLRFLRNAERLFAHVREVLDAVGPRRVMWGTDAPHYRPLVPDSTWAAAFRDGPFADEETDAILGGTAAAFFGLT
ncbi:MAG TPA: amidohydrolase family protein [Actinomycetota bacterium]|nr:amidohydrolase family protein [Actinomycetota bacterium]